MKLHDGSSVFTLLPIAAAAGLAVLGACASRPGSSPPPGHDESGMMHMPMPAMAGTGGEEQAAYEHARPVFEKFCFKCHTSNGAHSKPKALKHLNMDAYPFTGHHASEAGAAVREALGATGEEPTMPGDDPGVVKGDDLAAVLAWADAFDKAHQNDAASHEHDDDTQPAHDGMNDGHDGGHDDHDHMHHMH